MARGFRIFLATVILLVCGANSSSLKEVSKNKTVGESLNTGSSKMKTSGGNKTVKDLSADPGSPSISRQGKRKPGKKAPNDHDQKATSLTHSYDIRHSKNISISSSTIEDAVVIVSHGRGGSGWYDFLF